MKVLLQNAELLLCKKLGTDTLKVYVELIEEKEQYRFEEFFFTINDTYIEKDITSIGVLYKIFCCVKESLIDYIEKKILTKIEDGYTINLYIEPYGNKKQSKFQLYKAYLEKIAKKYKCSLYEHDKGYVLSFDLE